MALTTASPLCWRCADAVAPVFRHFHLPEEPPGEVVRQRRIEDEWWHSTVEWG
jgi:hypothetical protein